MKKQYIGDLLLDYKNVHGIEALKKEVYGSNYHHEIEGMRLWIERRQTWCKNKIVENVKKGIISI